MPEIGEKLDTLFYELDMRTDGFEKGLHESHEAITNFTEFIATKPVLAVGALVAMFATVGLAGAEMAEQIENSMKRIEAVLPEGAGDIKDLREEITALSLELPHSQEELAALAEVIAKMGVRDVGEIGQRLRAAVVTADATGVDPKVMIEELDQVLDLFQLKSSQAETVLAKLFATARGKVGMDELLESFRMAAPAVQRFHLSLDDTARAFATLRDQGYRARQAASELTRLAELGADGAARMRELIDATAPAASSFADVEKAADKANDNMGALWQRIKNELAPTLIQLGEDILPVVVAELKGLAGLIALFDGSVDKIKMNSFLTTFQVLGQNIDPDKVDAASESYKRFTTALSEVQEGFRTGLVDPAKMSKEALEQSLVAIDKYLAVSDKLRPNDNFPRANLAPLREALQKALADAQEAAKIAHDLENTDTGGGKGRGRTAAQIAEDIARARERSSALTTLSTAVANGAADPTAALEARITALRRSVQDAVKHGVIGVQEVEAAIQKMRENFAKTQADAFKAFRSEVDASLATFTGGQADPFSAAMERRAQALQQELDKHKEINEVDRKAQQDRIDDFRKQSAAQTEVLKKTDEAAKLIAKAQSPTLIRDGGFSVLLQQIEDSQAKMRAAQKGLNEDSLQYKTLQESINALEQARLSIVEGVSQANEADVDAIRRANELRQVQVQHMTQIASYIRQGVDAALQLGQAFGIVDQQAAQVLSSVASIAEALPAALSGSPTAIFSVIGSATSIIGSLFGDSPEKQAQRKTMAENTEALRKLTDKVGLLGSVNLSGQQSTAAVDVASQLRNNGLFDSSTIKSVFSVRGLTTEQADALKKAAAEYGIALDGTVDSYRKAVNAILEGAGKLGEFSDDFAGFTAQAEAARKIFGRDNPAQQLKDLGDAAQKASPAIAKLFSGLDLTNPDDLEKLRKRVQDFFTVMESGGAKLSSADLGSLTGDQLVQFLEQIIGGIDAVSPAAQTLSDKLANLQRDFQVLDIKSPTDQLKRVFALMSSQSPALADLAKGLDLNTTAGIGEFQKRLRDLYTTLTDGSATIKQTTITSAQLAQAAKGLNLLDPADLEEFGNRVAALKKQLADSGGIDAGTLSVQELIDAIVQLSGSSDAAAQELKQAAQTLVDVGTQLRDLRRGFDILGVTDPVQQLKEILALYSKVSPALKSLFDTFDLSTQQGRAAAEAAIKDFYRQNLGKTNIDAQGGLTDDELKDALDEVIQGIRGVQPEDTAQAGTDTTRQESGAERITIQQADRLLSMTQTMVTLLRKVADSTQAIKDLLAPILFSPVAVPSLSGSGASAPRSLQVNVTNVNQFSGDMSLATASEYGNRLGASLAESLNYALGGNLQNLRAAAGDPTVTLS